MTFECPFCKKQFAKEKSIEVHMCEPKRRHVNKDDPGVRLGFQAYLRFYEMHQGSAKQKTYEDFAGSSYYLAFVKFGHYCINTKVIAPGRFMDWLLKQNKKIDRWCSDQVYTEYLIWYLPTEAVDDALTRSIEYSIDWSEKTGHPAEHCLRYGNTNAACYAITTGRISPWVIYNSDSGVKFLNDLTSEQVSIIYPYINTDVWHKKFIEYPDNQQYARDILKKAGW